MFQTLCAVSGAAKCLCSANWKVYSGHSTFGYICTNIKVSNQNFQNKKAEMSTSSNEDNEQKSYSFLSFSPCEEPCTDC